MSRAIFYKDMDRMRAQFSRKGLTLVTPRNGFIFCYLLSLSERKQIFRFDCALVTGFNFRLLAAIV